MCTLLIRNVTNVHISYPAHNPQVDVHAQNSDETPSDSHLLSELSTYEQCLTVSNSSIPAQKDSHRGYTLG